MISEQIQNTLDDVKKTPNCEWRNKVISHLKDALACSMALDIENGIMTRNRSYNASQRELDGKNGIKSAGSECQLCRPGMIDVNCPVHGGHKNG